MLDCLILAAGLSLGLVVGLGLAGLTSTPVAALHVGSERLLAGFDALSGVPHARAPEESADSYKFLDCPFKNKAGSEVCSSLQRPPQRGSNKPFFQSMSSPRLAPTRS